MAKKKKYPSSSKTTRQRFQKQLQRLSSHKIKLVVGIAIIVAVLVVVARFSARSEEVETVSTPVVQAEVETILFGQQAVSQQATGTIKNLNTVTLVAQSSGPISAVNVVEGDQVSVGSVLLQQSSAYDSGNAAAVASQRSYNQYLIANETFITKEATYELERTQIDLVEDNAEELRKISDQALNDTKDLIDTLEDQVDYYQQQLDAASTDAARATQRSTLITFQTSLNAQKATLRSLEYEADDDNPPAKLAEIERELAIKALTLNFTTARLNRDIAWLSYQEALINQARTRVAAPFAGTIEKVFHQPGEYVTAGEPVFVLRGSETQLCLVVPVAGSLAQQINPTQTMAVALDSTQLEVPINHVSQTNVNGSLYEVLTILPNTYANLVYEGQAVSVELPLQQVTTTGGNSFLPLEAVYVTNTARYVMVAQDGRAVRRDINTGGVIGNQIEVITGLVPGEAVILDRRVVAGQAISTGFEE